MSNCNLIATPMVMNKKLSKDDGAQKADASIYRSLVASLIYLSNTRPDIVHTVSLVSRFIHEPSRKHFEAAKRILQCVQGTKTYGIRYTSEKENKLVDTETMIGQEDQ